MTNKWTCVWLVLAVVTPVAKGTALMVDLGTAQGFAVLGGQSVTNTGPTVVVGNLGVWPGTSAIGFPPGIVTNGVMEVANAVAQQAQTDLGLALVSAAGQACDTSLTGQDLGGLTLVPGVYCFNSSAQLTGMLRLDGLGNPGAVWLFQIGSALTTASGASVVLENAAQGSHVFWQLGSSATLGTSTAFVGTLLAQTSITINTFATIDCGRALASGGAVTMDSNTISLNTLACADATAGVPEPASATIAALGLLWMLRKAL